MATYNHCRDRASFLDGRKSKNYSLGEDEITMESETEMELDEWHGQLENEQRERLLLTADDSEIVDDIEYKAVWHLRTGWAIVFSALAAALAFAILAFFARLVIVTSHPRLGLSYAVESIGGFRRPADEYILDPKWDSSVAPTVRKYDWKIVNIVGNPDGVFRPMLTINGLFPGPLIECNEGDTLLIDVENQSVNSTSIHFHGLFQNGTNFMDGTPGVTQCPIAPRRKYRYKFKTSRQSGTYYYHGHQAIQASDGLFGPLVIHSRDEKKLQYIPYASDRVVMLQDYYHDLSSGLLVSALEPGSESPPIPDGALINGLNQRDCSQLGHRMCDNSTATLPSFDLTPNAHHRLRFINVGALAWFQMSIDEHEFVITEADGTDIVPAHHSQMMIGPAQRYSMILNTNITTGSSFWLRARMVAHCWQEPSVPGPGADTVRAMINYGAPRRTELATTNDRSHSTSRPWNHSIEVQCQDMNTTSWVPSVYAPPPRIADHSYYLRSNIEIGDWRLQRGFYNTSSFRPELSSPTLHRTIDGFASQNISFLAPDGVNTAAYHQDREFLIQHSGVKAIDVIIQNFDEGNHPSHLHGHKFWVLGQGHGMFPGYERLGLQPDGKGLLPWTDEQRFANLIRRDVATAEGFGWLALRFISDNPGVWVFHCHLAWHAEAGLSMLFSGRTDELASWQIPRANRELCDAPDGELAKGAVPKDSIWFGFGIGG